jgi:hypothetical protein
MRRILIQHSTAGTKRCSGALACDAKCLAARVPVLRKAMRRARVVGCRRGDDAPRPSRLYWPKILAGFDQACKLVSRCALSFDSRAFIIIAR